jgi:hypothetical protein
MDTINIEEVSWLHVSERAAEELQSYWDSNEDTGKTIAIISQGFG